MRHRGLGGTHRCGLGRGPWRALRAWWLGRRVRGDRRRRLHGQVHALRRELADLRRENNALRLRNAEVERLSSRLMEFSQGLAHAGRHDPLTGLLNRGAFEVVLGDLHAASRAAADTDTPRPYAVMMIDVDCFKAYNDRFGHPAGDRCLQAVAAALRAAVRRSDFLARYGGEEFVVVAPDLGPDAAATLAPRLCDAVRGLALPHPANTAGPVVTVSLGLAVGLASTDDARPSAEVLRDADRRLYAAKDAGRDRARVA
ncbi:MAG: diguanylate cyclase [Planctomycetota bacterium]